MNSDLNNHYYYLLHNVNFKIDWITAVINKQYT